MVTAPVERMDFMHFVQAAPASEVEIALSSFVVVFFLSDYVSLLIVRKYLSIALTNFSQALTISFMTGTLCVFMFNTTF
jgi:hypothetical protein